MKTPQATLVLVLSLATLSAFSQSASDTVEIKRNTFFIEAGGNALIYSLNFDRQLMMADKWRLVGRVGAMYSNAFGGHNRNMVGVPIEFSYLRGSKNNFLELGLGISGIYDQYYIIGDNNQVTNKQVKDLIMMSVLRIGYRHQKREGGLFYKFGFTPLRGIVFDVKQNSDNKNSEKFTYPLIGAAIGWTLRG